MPQYQLYNILKGRIQGAEIISAEDDNKALTQALTRCDGEKAELWRGARKLITIFHSNGQHGGWPQDR